MSENTVNAALRRLGYSKDEMTGPGFRSIASTHLNEQGWHRDAIERQLAHAKRDNARAAYNFAEHLPERRKMMQAWADYLDGLRVADNCNAGSKFSRGGRLKVVWNRGAWSRISPARRLVDLRRWNRVG